MDEKIVIREIKKEFRQLFIKGYSPEAAINILKLKLIKLSIEAIEGANTP